MFTLENFINYLTTVGFDKLIRIFWFFFIFEFFRYIIVDLIALIFWKIRSRFTRKKQIYWRRRLHIEKPFVSIIIPGKNEGKHIYKLVSSLREQTYTNFEIIVVDDGSDDDTPIICNSLKKNGYINHFIRNEVRGGKASGANTALRFATGQFVVHLDADCSYDRDAIENIILPFYMDHNIGAVGGNVMVRNYKESLCTTLQAIEYSDTIHIGRTVSSFMGIYRIISGAFGAFRMDVLHRIQGWDIGPGLDGDITVKIRKLGYRIYFEPNSVCQTNVPGKFRSLAKQRMRWDKSLVRFRLRKHRNVFNPGKRFSLLNAISFTENITYNVILNIKWFVYLFDMLINFSSQLPFIVYMNILLYTANNYLKWITFSLFRERKNANMWYFMWYLPLMVFYFGLFLRMVRSVAYFKEFFFRASYKDPWNPEKTSKLAKEIGI